MDLKSHIRTIPDFPKPGILFYDITTLLLNADAFQHALDKLHEVVERTKPDHLVALSPEASSSARRSRLDRKEAS